MPPSRSVDPPRSSSSALRRGLLLLFAGGALGLLAELVLLEHYEEWIQRLPLVLLAVGPLVALGCAVGRGGLRILALETVSALYVAAGIAGWWQHYRGNVEFELEMEPMLSGFALMRAALEGATPTLAPGAMVFLGLIGLLYTRDDSSLLRSVRPPSGDSS